MPYTSVIITIVRKGWSNTALEAAINAGADGGTVLFGRGVGVNEKATILGIPIEPEKEIVLTLVRADQKDAVLREIVRATELEEPGRGLAFVMPVETVVGVPHTAADEA